MSSRGYDPDSRRQALIKRIESDIPDAVALALKRISVVKSTLIATLPRSCYLLKRRPMRRSSPVKPVFSVVNAGLKRCLYSLARM